jgi:hypothetical protein
MTEFILFVSLSFGTSLLVHRHFKHRFSIIFLVVLLMLFCLTEKRMQHVEDKFSESHGVVVDN